MAEVRTRAGMALLRGIELPDGRRVAPSVDEIVAVEVEAALQVGRLRALLEDLYDRSTPMHSQTCAMQDDEAECICGTGAVLERVSAELTGLADR